MLALPLVLESHFHLAEETGTSAKAPWIFGLLYSAFGLTGIRVIFWVGGILLLAIAGYFAQQWRTSKKSITAIRQQST